MAINLGVVTKILHVLTKNAGDFTITDMQNLISLHPKLATIDVEEVLAKLQLGEGREDAPLWEVLLEQLPNLAPAAAPMTQMLANAKKGELTRCPHCYNPIVLAKR